LPNRFPEQTAARRDQRVRRPQPSDLLVRVPANSVRLSRNPAFSLNAVSVRINLSAPECHPIRGKRSDSRSGRSTWSAHPAHTIAEADVATNVVPASPAGNDRRRRPIPQTTTPPESLRSRSTGCPAADVNAADPPLPRKKLRVKSAVRRDHARGLGTIAADAARCGFPTETDQPTTTIANEVGNRSENTGGFPFGLASTATLCGSAIAGSRLARAHRRRGLGNRLDPAIAFQLAWVDYWSS